MFLYVVPYAIFSDKFCIAHFYVGVFKVLMATEKKLFCKRVVLALRDLYRLPEGRRLNKWCPGCDVSFIIFLALER